MATNNLAAAVNHLRGSQIHNRCERWSPTLHIPRPDARDFLKMCRDSYVEPADLIAALMQKAAQEYVARGDRLDRVWLPADLKMLQFGHRFK